MRRAVVVYESWPRKTRGFCCKNLSIDLRLPCKETPLLAETAMRWRLRELAPAGRRSGLRGASSSNRAELPPAALKLFTKTRLGFAGSLFSQTVGFRAMWTLRS